MDADVKAGLDAATTKEDVERVFADFVAKTEAPKKRRKTSSSKWRKIIYHRCNSLPSRYCPHIYGCRKNQRNS